MTAADLPGLEAAFAGLSQAEKDATAAAEMEIAELLRQMDETQNEIDRSPLGFFWMTPKWQKPPGQYGK